jgi:hypothetical protein
MTVRRGVSSDGGRTYQIPAPTFTESLLMELLIQTIPPATDDERIKEILIRAGFTDDEIAERFE